MKRSLIQLVGLLIVLFGKMGVAHPAPGNHPPGEWLKDTNTLAAMLKNLCLPERDYSDMREIGFFPCREDDPDRPIKCAVSMTEDDEGGGRYLINPKPMQGLNGVLFQGICSGGDHCPKPMPFGTIFLYADSMSGVFYIDGSMSPQKLTACQEVK